jgi:hypothetical protein
MQEELKRMELESEINDYQSEEYRFIKRRNKSCATDSSNLVSKSISINPSAINVKRIKPIKE